MQHQSTAAGCCRVLHSWLREQAGWQEQPLGLFVQHTAVPGRTVRAAAGNCQLRLCMGLAWQAQVEWSINKILLVTKLMELPPHSPEGDLTAHKKVKYCIATEGLCLQLQQSWGVCLG